MKRVQLFSLISFSIIQHLSIDIAKGEIVSDDDSHYKFNFTWSPSVLRNGKNYTLYVSTDEKEMDIDKFKLCMSIKIDSLNQTFFDDCIDTRCETLKDIISSLFPKIEVVDCPFTTTYFQTNFTVAIDEWVPLIAGNFHLMFNVTLANNVIKGKGNINIE